MQVSTDEFDVLHEAMAYVESDGKPRQLKADESWRGISNRKTLHELLRRLETLVANDGLGLRPGWDQRWLHIEQAAELYFSGSELQDVRLEPAKEKGGRDAEHDILRVRLRHFGLFAPYGPLPIHVTEHAKYERTFERNAGFEAFLNLLSGHLALLDYRAYANTHPVLSLYGHPKQAGFSARLSELASGWMAVGGKDVSQHIKRCRLAASFSCSGNWRAFPGARAAPSTSRPAWITPWKAPWQPANWWRLRCTSVPVTCCWVCLKTMKPARFSIA